MSKRLLTAAILVFAVVAIVAFSRGEFWRAGVFATDTLIWLTLGSRVFA